MADEVPVGGQVYRLRLGDGPSPYPHDRVSPVAHAARQLVQYPGEGHAILGRDHRLDLLRRSRPWFDRWIGPAAGFAPPA